MSLPFALDRRISAEPLYFRLDYQVSTELALTDESPKAAVAAGTR